jgi:hypothetical protein
VRAAAGVGPDQHLSHRHLSGLTITHRWGGPFSVTMDLTRPWAISARTAPPSTGWAASATAWP